MNTVTKIVPNRCYKIKFGLRCTTLVMVTFCTQPIALVELSKTIQHVVQ